MIRQSKKKSDKDKISLQDLQNVDHVAEYNRCKKNPVYFYNTYIRKEGQPVLNKGEYCELLREREEARNTKVVAFDECNRPVTTGSTHRTFPLDDIKGELFDKATAKDCKWDYSLNKNSQNNEQ